MLYLLRINHAPWGNKLIQGVMNATLDFGGENASTSILKRMIAVFQKLDLRQSRGQVCLFDTFRLPLRRNCIQIRATSVFPLSLCCLHICPSENFYDRGK